MRPGERRLLAGVIIALLVLAVLATWPLSAAITRALPGDLGDPLFVTWAIGWVNGQVLRGELASLWDANIFFPERQTLAFSEHFIGQALLVLPVHWMTGNLLLSYNLAFLLTFVLTGAGTFLLARALTGSGAGAALAAVVATFNEYRLVYEVAHLHTLSLHWLPFGLYALHRYFETDRRRYLAGAAAAFVALNLSSVYYMAYSAPLVLLFAAAEAMRTGRWRHLRVWLELWAAAAAVLVLSTPFLLPYIEVQQRLGVERSLEEVIRFSATLDHYRVALPAMSAALAWGVVGALAGAADRSLRWSAATAAILVGLAFWLSLGPVVQSGGQALDVPGLYRLFYDYAPGYRGLRVPARFAALVFLFLGVLAAVGVAAIERRTRRAAALLAAAAAVAFVLQARPATFPLHAELPSDGLAPPPAYLTPAPALPPIYQSVETLRPGAILAELPFGDSWYDLRYMYFSATHRRRLLNGYSGIFPPSFLARQRVLARPLLDFEGSARALSAATHVVVHRRAWTDDTGARVGAWLESWGARVVAQADEAVIYELPVREGFAE